MKGAVIIHFLDFLSGEYGEEFTDSVIDDSELKSGGAFTSVGYYPFEDMAELLTVASKKADKPAGDMLKAFGRVLFGVLVAGHEDSRGFDHPFDYFPTIHGVIHKDVRKLYPDAEVPEILVTGRDGNRSIDISYQSARPLADLCEGMIEAVMVHFGRTNFHLEREDVDAGRKARFRVMLAA